MDQEGFYILLIPQIQIKNYTKFYNNLADIWLLARIDHIGPRQNYIYLSDFYDRIYII